MSNRASGTRSWNEVETITKYECLFAVRTGLTILLPLMEEFDGDAISFSISPDNPHDIIVTAKDRKVILKSLKKEHLDASVARGFIMFYETKGDEVVRCTPCNYRKA
ncbi:MAG: hypothetical protein KGL10_01800 [Alphaproteobacteria bacterium]|nr:hypothetical protein [Alphaproteobacteria bacterium]MDE2336022.1 hypothetical protein [Alphaproteobacteria bacterium]